MPITASNGWVFPRALEHLEQLEREYADAKPSKQKWLGEHIDEIRPGIEAGWSEVEEQFVASRV